MLSAQWTGPADLYGRDAQHESEVTEGPSRFPAPGRENDQDLELENLYLSFELLLIFHEFHLLGLRNEFDSFEFLCQQLLPICLLYFFAKSFR